MLYVGIVWDTRADSFCRRLSTSRVAGERRISYGNVDSVRCDYSLHTVHLHDDGFFPYVPVLHNACGLVQLAGPILMQVYAAE